MEKLASVSKLDVKRPSFTKRCHTNPLLLETG